MKNPIVMKTWNTSSKGHDIFECSFRFGCNQNKGRNSTSQNKKKERNKMREEVRENSNNTIWCVSISKYWLKYLSFLIFLNSGRLRRLTKVVMTPPFCWIMFLRSLAVTSVDLHPVILNVIPVNNFFCFTLSRFVEDFFFCDERERIVNSKHCDQTTTKYTSNWCMMFTKLWSFSGYIVLISSCSKK